MPAPILSLALWLTLLLLIFLRPFPTDHPYPADDLIRNTIRVAQSFPKAQISSTG
jgi:hypothetical protein